jgi:O-acetyl-ADP-ribose deacetylase
MIQVIQQDITKMNVGAIVNAANSSLMGGGGVDGAIHRAGGPEILEACRRIVASKGPCKTGEAVITIGGKLLANYVIHTVGPVWNGGNHGEPHLLANCYRNCLQLANLHQVKSIAFPNISTGIYGFPKRNAAIIATKTVTEWIKNHDIPLDVYFVCFDEENFLLYQQLINGPLA